MQSLREFGAAHKTDFWRDFLGQNFLGKPDLMIL